MTRIAIIGGHGKVALLLSALLTGEGHFVTSFIRNPDHAGDVAGTGATPAVLDVENSTTEAIAGALAGHDAVVWSAGAGAAVRSAPTPWTGMPPSAPWMPLSSPG